MLEPERPASCPFAVYPSSALFSCRPLFCPALFACAKPVGRGRPAFSRSPPFRGAESKITCRNGESALITL